MNISNDSLFGLALFVGAYIVSRIVRERALKRLSAEQKARLLDAFSGYRTYFMSAAVCFPLLYFVAIKSWPSTHSFLAPIFFVLFGLMLVVMTWLSFRKLKELNLPTDYIRSFLVSSGIQYLGVACLFVPLLIRSLG
jgi:hypothetical protein